jgi:DNA recombination-dependent growth factor C
MWFKNFTLFRFTEPFTLSAAQIEEKLESRFLNLMAMSFQRGIEGKFQSSPET